jgi:glycerol-1-phosphate dehydrogenase [NAD(P)+]
MQTRTPKLPYDPADGERFWQEVSKLPGFREKVATPIQHLVFESGAVFHLSQVLESVGAQRTAPLVLVMDETPMRRSGEDLKELILSILRKDGWESQVAWMKPDASGQVHTDMPHIREVRACLSPGCSVLSVGSGVVTDIAKHGSFLYQEETGQQVPYVVFQTANSVSAYTSSMSPTFIDGVKRTLDSRYPDALVCDLETLRDAPHEMTSGGVGDMLAVYVSFPDWSLAHRLGMDPDYTELAKNLIGPLDELLLAHAEGIRTGELESVSTLAKIIALGGLAMSLSHVTTPMSGFEHVMSHVLDLQAEVAGLPLAVHGSQVALATLAGVEMYRQLLAEFDPARLNLDDCYPGADIMQERIERAFDSVDPSGRAAAECWADYRLKLENWKAQRAAFQEALNDWDTTKSRLMAETRDPSVITLILEKSGAPTRWSQLEPPISQERARFAFLHAAQMRKRFTLGDLMIFTSWDREGLWDEVWARYA